jgi:uncharacterized protein (TIGR02246 family)
MSSDEQEIRELVATWMRATKAGDTDTVLSLMTDDVVFLVTGQPPMRGKSAFAAALKAQSRGGTPPEFDGSSEIQEIRILGDWAWMWTKLSVVVTSPGAGPATRAGHTLSILRKEGGQWRLARDANMLARVDAAEGASPQSM